MHLYAFAFCCCLAKLTGSRGRRRCVACDARGVVAALLSHSRNPRSINTTSVRAKAAYVYSMHEYSRDMCARARADRRLYCKYNYPRR